MTLFWAIAAALAASALLFVLPPLLRTRRAAPDARAAANAEVYREQIAELEAERARGTLSAEEFERASRDVERRIVAEHAATAAPAPAPAGAVRAAIALALVVPLTAIVFYALLGEPRALDPNTNASPREMESLVARLTEQLKKQPEDAEGWALLGKALASLGHHERAAQALARALQLNPGAHDLVVQFIESLAMAGQAEFEARNYAKAIEYWERVLPFAPAGSQFAQAIENGLAEARKSGGAPVASSGGKPPVAAGGEAVQGTVTLAPSLKAQASPQDTVFVLARPAEGSRMPLAVARITVDKLPYRFKLDDSMAMSPAAKLSSQAKVVVVARISKSGNPAPQKGDIEGVSDPVAPGAKDVKVELRKVVD